MLILIAISFYLGIVFSTICNNENSINKNSIDTTNKKIFRIDNVAPFVITKFDEKYNTYTKEIHLAIRYAKNSEIEMIIGKIDTTKMQLIDTSLIMFSNLKDTFTYFEISNQKKDVPLEGVINIKLENNLIRSFPFSESKYKWWDN